MGLKFRRGSTAQQSGSLAFGEPYVNTTLGTLVVGGATGDIVLSAGGTGSTGNFGAISGSGLDITGNANIAGNLTLGGNITIGDQTSDTVTVTANLSSSLIPQTTNAFDLGSATKFWRDLYISTGSIKMVNPANNQVVTTITAVAGGGIQIGNVQISTASISFVDNSGNITQNIAQSSSAGSTSNYTTTSSFQSYTGSQDTKNSNLATISGSLISTASANSISVANLNAASSSYETKGRGIISSSAQLSGTTITNLTITNLTTVNETASVLFSSGSNTFGDFGDDTHSFTGSVKISGSFTLVGSSTATSYNGTINATNGVVSGSSQVTPLLPAGTVSGSSQIVGSSITTNTVTIGSTSTALGGTSTTLAGLTSVTSTGFTGALTGNASTATTLQTARLINGTSFDGSSNITIPNLVSGSGQISGTGITNNTVTLNGQSVTLGGSATIQNLVSGSSQIAFSGVTGTVSNAQLANSSVTITAGTGLSGGGAVSLGSSVTLNNAGVTSNVAGTGISVSGATGAVTITNTGVTSAVAGTGVSVSAGTGAVTISIGQAVATSSNVQFNSLGIGMVASATAGRIDATGDIVAYSTSDINFKENIIPIKNPIEKIKMISGNTYDWKADMKEFHGFEGNDVGVIAQEIEAVLPQLVTTRETGYKAVKYDKLVALLIEGIKTQQNQIDNLTIEIEKLKESKGL
jgi:hypothetical protein